jgi:nuclear cap-binding protein subunit 1
MAVYHCVLCADVQVVAPVSTVNGWTLRSLVLDIVTLFEVNRKECARILLGLRTFITPGTFKSSNPEESTSTLSLESLIISTLLSSMLNLPSAPFPQVYYTSLIAELCKASPNTVAPPVGRAVRKMFGMMGSEGLDVEVIRRTADWFATHLSNFGFQWMWKEWLVE